MTTYPASTVFLLSPVRFCYKLVNRVSALKHELPLRASESQYDSAIFKCPLTKDIQTKPPYPPGIRRGATSPSLYSKAVAPWSPKRRDFVAYLDGGST